MLELEFHAAIADARRPLPHPRFGVYRNNVFAALVNALRVRYPVTERIIGAAPFAALTRDYVAENKPASPVLIDYGADYPGFIAARAALPWLADVARLESLWWQAYHAADAEPLAPQQFAGLAPEDFETLRFGFHPSAAIVSSPWAIGAIWDAARQGAAPGIADIATPQSVLVWRPQAEVCVHVVDAAAHDFLAALMRGQTLADAIGEDPGFDLTEKFQMLIASQLVTSIATGTPA